VLHALKDGDVRRFWQLFYSARKVLDKLSEASEAPLVPLQCLPSLAVASNGAIVPLDLDIRAAGSLPPDSPVRQAYQTWFGAAGTSGFAESKQAKGLHRKALLAYFRQLAGRPHNSASPAARRAQEAVVTSLGQLPPDLDLDDLDGWLRNNTENWDLPVDDEEPSPLEEAAIVTAPRPRGAASPAPSVPIARPRKRRSLFLRLSLLLNLLLIAAVVLLWLLWPKDAFGKRLPIIRAALPTGSDSSAVDPSLTFSPYCMVFPTEGTTAGKVNESLAALFPGKVREIPGGAEERGRLLRQKRDDSVTALKEPEKLKKLLASLSTGHGVRFRGLDANAPAGSLPAVIEMGGIFTIDNGPKYGSLLQSNGLDKVLAEAGMGDQEEPRALLTNLRKAVADYASLEDALRVTNGRTAFLLDVEPTAAPHEAVRQKLLSRLDKPVFISRPLSELFDAVDPSGGGSSSSAEYTLTLDGKCFWRLAGQEDRRDVDFANNDSNDRMKWTCFDANKVIAWTPIPLTLKSGKTVNTATFDVAIPLSGRVVVFRNQNIMVGDSREKVVKQGKNYIERALKLNVSPEDAISVRPPAPNAPKDQQQYTGTLIYPYLADRATKSVGDLEVFDDMDQFNEQRATEDKALSP